MKTIADCLRATLTVIALLCVCVFAQGAESDSINVYFRAGKSNYEPAFAGNEARLASYLSKIQELNKAGCLDLITIEGYVSPDGRQAFNERLARRRAATMAGIFRERAGVDSTLIKTIPVGINWDELRELIEANPNVPSRTALLDIIDNTPVWVINRQGEIVGGRKQQMMNLQGGRPYRWLLTNIFPEMRKAVSITLSHSPLPAAPEPEPQIADEVEVFEDQRYIGVVDIDDVLPDTTEVFVEPHVPLHRFALKTNMLYDAILLPNIEVEWYIINRWSVTLEGNLAWWGRYADNRSYRLLMISPEVRYWFMRGQLRRGLFVGATVGGGLYDFLKDSPGHYGEGAIVGLTCGYQLPISRVLSLEAEIGAGYAYINDKEYVPLEGHHVFERKKAINYFGPIKAELSLVWRFSDILKPKAK